MMKILILTNSINGLYSFRKELVEELLKEGYEVIISAPFEKSADRFLKIGCKFIDTEIDRRGTNLVKDYKLIKFYKKTIKRMKPAIVLTYTIKPNVYGGLACRSLNVPYISNITGLGTSIEAKGLIQKISLILYKKGLKKANTVFFQNKSNMIFFAKHKIIKNKQTIIIPGSGVNLDIHVFEPYSKEDKIINFLFIGRIMKAKGIDELLKAAEIIKDKYPNVEFHIIGGMEEETDIEKINESVKNGIITYHGTQRNVHNFIKNSHALIHPSHHEGMSNVLLEAASTGRPVIASNIPGCKETFDEGVSGFGFEPKNINSLVEAINKFLNLRYEQKQKMGIFGRKKMEREFDRNIVTNAYLHQIKNILGEKKI